MCGILPTMLHVIKSHTQPQHILLVLSTHATCFCHTDRPHALNV